MIYVDSMGHCYSDSSLEELYDFCVTKLGLRPEWNHYSRGFPHFDLRDKTFLEIAVQAGATRLKNREMLKLVRRDDSPFSDQNLDPNIIFYRDTFRGREITRIDFAATFARRG